MACCGEEEETLQQGVVGQRKCRDVLCLLLFIAFWAGMFVVAAVAVRQGDVSRLVYGTDSYGFSCGSSTSFNGTAVDLSSKKNLYYLNPLDLLSIVNIPYAKTICVDECPSTPVVCNYTSLPCTSGSQYKCPYYMFADDHLYGQLGGLDVLETAYYDQLVTLSSSTDAAASAFIQKLQWANLPWVNNWLTTYSISSSGSVTGRYYQLQSQFPAQGPCYPIYVSTTSYFHRCFPSLDESMADAVVQEVGSIASKIGDDALGAFKDKWNSLGQKFSRYVGDISKGILIIVIAGLVGGVVLSLVWMIILRYLAGVMAWLTIILVNVALCGITLYCFSLAGLLGNNAFSQAVSDHLPNIGDPTVLERKQWKIIAIASAVVAGAVLLLTLLMIRRIRIAIACIKVASQAVGAMPSILLFPLLPFVLEVGLLIYWVSITALLYTAGTLMPHCRSSSSWEPFNFASLSNLTLTHSSSSSTNTTSASSCYENLSTEDMIQGCGGDPNCYLSYNWNNTLKYMFIYHFFGLLWTNQFIVGLACVTVAGAVASYYWAHGDRKNMPVFPVLASLKNTIIYHLGSIAFGALVIAIIQFIRFLLDYLDRKTKDLQAANKIASWAMCCVKCCMWCLEKIVKFINKNAYIMIGVKGGNYCVSAGRAVVLIVTNALRLITVNFMADILIFLGKVAVAAGSGLIAFGMADLPLYTNSSKYPDTYLSSPILPVALSILTGFVVSEIFFSVYEMAIDTIILAFCEDCDSNGGNPNYAPPLLMEAMGQDTKSYPPSNQVHPVS